MAVNNIDSLDLGKLTQIIFSEGLRFQLSSNASTFEMIKLLTQGRAGQREIRFAFNKGMGPNAIQWANPGTSAFPTAQKSSISENTATFKELDVTVKVDFSLWDRLRKNPEKYAEDLALEMQNKQIAYKRQISMAMHKDGTGVTGTVLSTAGVTVSSNYAPGTSNNLLKVLINPAYNARGNVNLFEIDDLFVIYATDGSTAHNAATSSGTAAYYKVVNKDRSATAPFVEFEVFDSSGTSLDCSGAGTIVATDAFWRKGSSVRPSIASTITADYGTLTDELVGLPSLIAADGRLVHGNYLLGSTGSTVLDKTGEVLDVIHLHELMDNLFDAVGKDTYKYSQVLANSKAIRALVEAREVDRLFTSSTDGTRGVRRLSYQHENALLEFASDEFCHPYNMYVLPDSRGDNSVLEFYFNDMEVVKPNGQGNGWMMEPSSSGSYNRAMVCFLHGVMTLINKHPQACGRLQNFVLA